MTERVRIPAEWEPHRACWMAYPHLADEWAGRLDAARDDLRQLVATIAGEGGEPVQLLVRDEATEEDARRRLEGVGAVDFIRAEYGDCWTRDTLPTFGVGESSGQTFAVRFQFNGWGGRFDMTGDETIGAWVAERFPEHARQCELFLEGGALELNGAGVCITTESCTLNANRNPGVDRDEVERALAAVMEVERIVWLTRGLDHDHTDGHVDMVVRFVSEDEVVCMKAKEGDPMEPILQTVQRELEDANLRVHLIPAPGPVLNGDRPLPGTYCNFYIANEAVIVPTFGVEADAEAVSAIGALFPTRTAVGLQAVNLLSQGGAFHCVTQPEPAASIHSPHPRERDDNHAG